MMSQRNLFPSLCIVGGSLHLFRIAQILFVSQINLQGPATLVFESFRAFAQSERETLPSFQKKKKRREKSLLACIVSITIEGDNYYRLLVEVTTLRMVCAGRPKLRIMLDPDVQALFYLLHHSISYDKNLVDDRF